MARTPIEPRAWSRLLVGGPNWVGDAVMAVPAIRAIRRAHPHLHITLLAKPSVARLLEPLPFLDDCLVLDGDGKHRGPFGYARLVKALRARGFDAALLLRNAFGAALLALLARIPERIGYRADGRSLLLTRPIPLPDEWRKGHRVHAYLTLARALGAETDEASLELAVDEAARAETVRTLDRFGIATDCRLAAIHPGAAYGSAKRWPSARYAAVAKGLAERGFRSLLLGGPGEAELAGRIAAECCQGTVVNLAGNTPSLQHLAALLGLCQLAICNDSGPMHIAAALGLPVVAIFGSTSPEFTAPLCARREVLHAGLACSPCFQRECPQGTAACLEAIDADSVLAACDRVLNGIGGEA